MLVEYNCRMRFALTTDHREFFNQMHFIELENVLSQEHVGILKQNAKKTFASRLQSLPKTAQCMPLNRLQAAYDLWRENPLIKKIVHKTAFASLAAELLDLRAVRFGFDQWIDTTENMQGSLNQCLSLQDHSALSPLAGGLLLPLTNLQQPLSFPLPMRTGNALFITASFSIPWHELFATPSLQFLLIAFAQKTVFFRAGTPDPHARFLKKLGYVFNDKLKDSLHPILLRN